MATFYSVWGPTNTAYRCYISESRSQNISNNTSTVSVTCYFQTQYGWGITDSNTHVRARVRGANVIDKTYALSVGVNTSKNIGSGSRTLTHNADGTLSNSAVELLVNTRNTGLFNNTASGTISHPTIPRATTPSSGNFTTGSATSISLPRASSSFTHEVTYKVGSATGTISSSAGTSVSWTPAHSLGSQFPNATSATVTITVKTKNGSTVIGTKTMNKTLTLASSQKPTASSVTFTDQTAVVKNNIGAFVQGKSVLRATIAGSGIQGSTIPSGNQYRRVTINGVTYNQNANIPMPTSGSRNYTGRITDSRGREGTVTGSITVLPYTNPRIVAAHAYRVAVAGGPETDSGNRLRLKLETAIQSLKVGTTEKNSHTIVVRTRPRGGSWSDPRHTINAALSYNNTFDIAGGAIYNDTTSWEVQVTITDKIGTVAEWSQMVITAIPALDLNGTNVGIGKMHEQGALDVGPGGIYSDGALVQPPGVVCAFAGDSAPNGWLLCQGQAVSRTTYSDLFAILGTQYGSGNGTSTFNLPNLQGRVPVGLSSGETEFNALGKTGGAKTHTLTTAQIPAHKHQYTSDGRGVPAMAPKSGTTPPNVTFLQQSIGNPREQWAIAINGPTSPGTVSEPTSTVNTGSGSSHNNLQPYAVMNYIIKI